MREGSRRGDSPLLRSACDDVYFATSPKVLNPYGS